MSERETGTASDSVIVQFACRIFGHDWYAQKILDGGEAAKFECRRCSERKTLDNAWREVDTESGGDSA